MLESGIVTASAGELLGFYTDGMGFSVHATFEFPQGVVHRLRRGDAHLKLFEPTSPTEVSARPEPWHRRSGFAYAALHVDDVEEVFARAAAAGAEVLTEPTSHRPGARYALIADPQGNVWELLEERP